MYIDLLATVNLCNYCSYIIYIYSENPIVLNNRTIEQLLSNNRFTI